MTGFGAALVAIPLLSLFIDVKLAVPLTILNGLIITTYLAASLRSHLEVKKILPLLIGAIPGLFVGVILFKVISTENLKLLLGFILILYSSYCLLLNPKARDLKTFWAYLAGFLTGATTVILSAGGPPTIIYTTLTRWTKETIKATLTGFFAINAYLAVTAQAFGGFITLEILTVFLKTGLFVLVGTVAGAKMTARINKQTYLRLIHLLLITMGVVMLLG